LQSKLCSLFVGCSHHALSYVSDHSSVSYESLTGL
jgi:hypothetical protein